MVVAFSSYAENGGDAAGQVFALMAIAVAAAEVAIGLAMFIVFYRTFGTIDLDEGKMLRWMPPSTDEVPMKDVANSLFEDYSFALIILGMLLAASVLGGIYLARKEVED